MSESNGMAVNLIRQRGNRTAASLMTYLEDNIQEYLPGEVWAPMRLEVLESINDFKDLAIDIVKSDTAMINEEYLEHLLEIKRELRHISGNGSR